MVTPDLASTDRAALARTDLLRGLPATLTDALTQRARFRRLKPREVVFSEGDPGHSLFVVLPKARGIPVPGFVALRVTGAKEDETVLAALVPEGGVFGEIEVVSRQAERVRQGRALEARAISDTRIAELPWSAVHEAVTQSPALQVRLAGLLADRAALLVDSLRAIAADRLETRLARLLLALDGLFRPRGQIGRNMQATTQQDLAELVGARRESVNQLLSQWRRAGILEAGADSALVLLDIARLRRLVSRAGFDDVRMALDRGRVQRARALALDVVPREQDALEWQHLAVLACARAGATDDAAALLRRFGFVHGGDVAKLAHRLCVSPDDPLRPALFEDIAALEPRLAKDKAWALPPGPERRLALLNAATAYRHVFEATGRPYTGVNAASLLALAGDLAGAGRLAEQVSAIASSPDTYWTLVTRAETELLLGRIPSAVETLRKAARSKDGNAGARASTRRQLRQVAKAVGADWAQLDEALPQPPVIVFAGTGSTEMGSPSQIAALEAEMDAVVQRLGPCAAFGGLSPGAELLWAGSLIRVGAELNAVLPSSVTDFADATLRPADRRANGLTPTWSERFETCLHEASSIQLDNGHLARAAMGLALLHADLIEAPVHLLLVGDTADDLARLWTGLRHPVTRLTSPWPSPAPALPLVRRAGSALLLVVGTLSTIGRTPRGTAILGERRLRSRQRLTLLRAMDIDHAIEAGQTFAAAGLRVVLDWSSSRDQHDPEVVASQVTEFLADAPHGVPCASPSFAAEARLVKSNEFVFALASRTGPGSNLFSNRLYCIGLRHSPRDHFGQARVIDRSAV